MLMTVFVALLTACSFQLTDREGKSNQTNPTSVPSEEKQKREGALEARVEETAKRKVNEFNLVAKEVNWELTSEYTITAWTYNGTVPGEQIRVTEGEVVKVTLNNELNEPVTIHWHGIPVSNSQDGVPGMTQDAVLPGEKYTYEFVAEHPGTYWYHSHQNGVEQIDKGLYGTIIVEPKAGVDADRDYTLVLDEWESGSGLSEGSRASSGMMGGHGGMMKNMMMHDMSSYDIFTINGKTYAQNKPLKVKKGEKVALRFVNAGYMVHKMHIPVKYKVTHIDGQPVNNPKLEQSNILEIAPGERYDIQFVADGKGDFTIDCHGDMAPASQMQMDVVYENRNSKKLDHPLTDGVVDVTELGEKTEGLFSRDDSFDVEYKMNLGVKMDHKNMQMLYTINGKAFPDVPPLKVAKGDKVKVTLTNRSMDGSVHPMHLHGHFFQVLTKNGKSLEGSPIIKDTLNIKPGESYEVAFFADNPGNWLFHCHDLHHASTGMVGTVEYNNFKPFYKDTGKVKNIPE